MLKRNAKAVSSKRLSFPAEVAFGISFKERGGGKTPQRELGLFLNFIDFKTKKTYKLAV